MTLLLSVPMGVFSNLGITCTRNNVSSVKTTLSVRGKCGLPCYLFEKASALSRRRRQYDSLFEDEF